MTALAGLAWLVVTAGDVRGVRGAIDSRYGLTDSHGIVMILQ